MIVVLADVALPNRVLIVPFVALPAHSYLLLDFQDILGLADYSIVLD